MFFGAVFFSKTSCRHIKKIKINVYLAFKTTNVYSMAMKWYFAYMKLFILCFKAVKTAYN